MTFLLVALMFLAQGSTGEPPVVEPDMPSLQCVNKCHREHCDCWVRCNDIPDEAAQLVCKKQCEKDEGGCTSHCNLG